MFSPRNCLNEMCLGYGLSALISTTTRCQPPSFFSFLFFLSFFFLRLLLLLGRLSVLRYLTLPIPGTLLPLALLILIAPQDPQVQTALPKLVQRTLDMLSITVPFELNKKDVIPGQEPAGPTRNTCKIKPKILEDLQTIAKCPRNLMINGER